MMFFQLGKIKLINVFFFVLIRVNLNIPLDEILFQLKFVRFFRTEFVPIYFRTNIYTNARRIRQKIRGNRLIDARLPI